MTPAAIARAADILRAARAEGRLIDALPADARPATLAEAYAVQARLVERLAQPLAGWFLGCTNVEVQRTLGLDGPYWGRLLEGSVRSSPAAIAVPAAIAPVLEVEIAFRLGRNLPPRPAPYERDEVAAAVATVHLAIEVVIPHFRDWTHAPIAWLVADNGTDGALVTGAGVADWRGLDLAALSVILEVNGRPVRQGRGAAAMGDPLAALTWLANARAAAGDGLETGHLHNTGTLTAMYGARVGDRARAVGGPLGEVSLRLSL